jgi:hypothetical protein
MKDVLAKIMQKEKEKREYNHGNPEARQAMQNDIDLLWHHYLHNSRNNDNGKKKVHCRAFVWLSTENCTPRWHEVFICDQGDLDKKIGHIVIVGKNVPLAIAIMKGVVNGIVEYKIKREGVETTTVIRIEKKEVKE